ncbi:MAG TPA: chromate efflux transporter [Solirubrobacterales bacterium]|nr:chromate efflux transporter [Solirubrobacterales bacterium]
MESPGAIFLRFLKFGCLAWGGPAAQIAMIKRECVDEEKWIDELSFQRLLAVYQVLPGPEAHELCVYFGRVRGGKLGGLMAGLGFMLPGFVLMLGLSALYVEADIAENLDALFYGLSAAVGALVARALVRLGTSFIKDVPLALIAVAGFALTFFADASFVLVLLGGGIAYELWRGARGWFGGGAPSIAIGLPALPWIAAGAITIGLTGEILLEGLKAGLLTFGGAYTVVPLLHASAVDGHHWLTESQFVDGLAIGGILPAPLIIFATFVGYLAGGPVGAIVITLGIFVPAFCFPIFLHRQLVAIAENERLHQFLLGIAAGVIGLIAAVTVEILDTSVVDGYTAALALGAFLALNRWHGKLTVLWVVLSCGAIGALLQLTVV